MFGVRAFPYRTQTIECWNAETSCEVAVRASAHRDLLEFESESASDCLRLLEQCGHLPGSFQWRAVDATLDGQRAVLVYRAQVLHTFLHHRPITLACDAEIDLDL